MHFSCMLTAVVVTCATGALAAQLTVASASDTIEDLYRQVDFFAYNILQAGGNDAGDVSKAFYRD